MHDANTEHRTLFAVRFVVVGVATNVLRKCFGIKKKDARIHQSCHLLVGTLFENLVGRTHELVATLLREAIHEKVIVDHGLVLLFVLAPSAAWLSSVFRFELFTFPQIPRFFCGDGVANTLVPE